MLTVAEVDWQSASERCLNIRRRVFIEEQGIAESVEIDGRDPWCCHVIATLNDQDVGTARMLPDAHVGRVGVLQSARRQGVGAAIMQELARIARQKGYPALHLAAQASAVSFYRGLGYQAHGEPFIVVGIEHQNMSLEL